jgi:AhpD family alkylhydroperoxidase
MRFGILVPAPPITKAITVPIGIPCALSEWAIGVAVQCEDCVLWHLDGALEAGVATDEVEETLTVAVVMGGGPALMYATTAHQMLQEFLDG